MEYAHATDRIVITHDDDDYADPDLSDRHRGVFYCPNQRLSSFEIFRIVTEVAARYPDREAFPPVVYLTTEWL